MRGLTKGEFALLLEEDEPSTCNCGPDGTPGRLVSHPRIAERLVTQGRAVWAPCDFGHYHFCLTGNGKTVLRIHRLLAKS
jgi:hypothetical protein